MNRRTMFFIIPGKEQDLSEASAVIDKVSNTDDGASIQLTVNLPHDSVIGYFKFMVIAKKKEDTKFAKYKHNEDIIVLFNPWMKGNTICIAILLKMFSVLIGGNCTT